MPPVREAERAVTTMFEPAWRSSRFTLSPIESITPSMDVATVAPMAMAAMAKALRRGARPMESLTKRKIMASALLEQAHSGVEYRLVEDQGSVLDARFHRHGIAAPLGSYGGNDDVRTAEFADDFRAFLVIAFRAADLAGVERDSKRFIGPFDDDEADAGTAIVDHEAVQIAVAHRRDRKADCAAIEGDRQRGGERGRFAGVDELRGDQKDENAGGGAGGGHPHAIPARGPADLAERRAFESLSLRRPALTPFQQHHGGGEGEDGYEEKDFVVDDGADQRHLAGAGGQIAALREFMQAGDGELRDDDHKDDGGHLEKLAEVDPDRAADEADTEQEGKADAEDCAKPFEDAFGADADCRE